MAYAIISTVPKTQIATATSCGFTMTKIDIQSFPTLFTIFSFVNNIPIVYHPEASERNQGRVAGKTI